jgi:CHAD domain-containing protein
MARFRKWISRVSADDRLVDVALRSLKGRLAAVQHYLPLAAEHAAEDVEHVHQLRVWSRRAEAALKLYWDLLPRQLARWVKRKVKHVRRAAGNARDCDVLIQRLSGDESQLGAATLLETVRAQRSEAQRPILDRHERLIVNGRFARRAAMLLKRTRRRNKDGAELDLSFGEWAELRLEFAVAEFFDAAAADLTDDEALHQFRIRAKQLRYVMELLAAAFPRSFRKQLYSRIASLQDKLGAINDHRMAIAQIGGWLDEHQEPHVREYLQSRLSAEQSQLTHSRREFFAWWTSQREQKLREEFDALRAEAMSHAT